MSRLYEALKEASRRRGENNGDNGLWEHWQNDGLEIPPINAASQLLRDAGPGFSDNHSGQAQQEQEEVSAPEADVIASAIEEDDPIFSLTAEVDAELDHDARLIPFAIDSSVVEHYRRLRTKIMQEQEVKPFRSLVVTSAAPQEGKTVTVLNLALSFSALPSFRVLVIDGDTRKGTLGNWLGVSNDQPGLSNLLDGSARLEDVVLKSDQVPMHFMVRGNAQIQDMHPSRYANYFQRLRDAFDLVLVDSPPANLLVDVQMLAANTEAVLLVARAFSTSRKAFAKAVQELTPFRLLGVVLNAGVPPRSRSYRGYY
jgi:capsular exopolysaccharide synthesis family protein